jgi:hypothetical protein
MSGELFQGSPDDIVRQLSDVLQGKKCWSVACGGATFPTIRFYLGQKQVRLRPLLIPRADETSRFYGEWNLLVFCAWRLDSADRVLTGSTDSPESAKREIENLVGATIEGVKTVLPGWDLTVCFSNRLKLRAFSDQLSAEGVLGNWELWSSTLGLCIKKQALINVVHRSPRSDPTLFEEP